MKSELEHQGFNEQEAAKQFRVGMKIDPPNDKYPFCLVWTALPCLTCCIPCIGHTGICKSDGTIYDFVGSGPMHSDTLAFGAPLKYFQLDHEEYTNQQWDAAVKGANRTFEKTQHNLITNNCHHHVAEVLNILKYKGKTSWGQVDIALMAMKGTHINLCSYYVYVVFALILVLIFFYL